MFGAYLGLGFEHILDPNGYDHILFVLALSGIYLLKDWRQVLILVTAFTIGHSLTLALSALNLVKVNADLVEFLIPITIVLTCLYNILRKEHNQSRISWNYLIALGFGLIHGLGFSNYFKAILGKEESIVLPLFAFNVGVELGQVIIVIVALIVASLVVRLLKVSQRKWTLFLSATIALWAMYLIVK